MRLSVFSRIGCRKGHIMPYTRDPLNAEDCSESVTKIACGDGDVNASVKYTASQYGTVVDILSIVGRHDREGDK
jgi:hypothetical protein